MDDEAWAAEWVKRAIRTEMARGGWTYASLTDALRSTFMLDGDEWNEKNVANKVGRGTCSAAFFVRCMMAMGVKTLDLEVKSPNRFVDADGRRYSVRPLKMPGGMKVKPGYNYEMFGITANWRYKREAIERLISKGYVVQPTNGAPPVLKVYEDERITFADSLDES